MTILSRHLRTLMFSAFSLAAASGASAQSWDLDACTGGTKLAAGYTNCGASSGSVKVNVTAYSASTASSNFSTASTTVHNGGSYIGVYSGNENTGSGTTDSPHHAIDNVTAFGNSVELVHLSFSKAVDLSSIVAFWAYSDADFQVFRWNNNGAVNITGLTPSQMPTVAGTNLANASNGWQLVTAGDFSANTTQSINNNPDFYSSHWLVSTAIGGTNDGFKLGTVHAAGACIASNQTGSAGTTGLCNTTTNNTVPEPASLAMVLVAALGAGVARRRRQAV